MYGISDSVLGEKKKTIQHKKEEIRPRTLEGEHIPLQPKGKKAQAEGIEKVIRKEVKPKTVNLQTLRKLGKGEENKNHRG